MYERMKLHAYITVVKALHYVAHDVEDFALSEGLTGHAESIATRRADNV